MEWWERLSLSLHSLTLPPMQMARLSSREQQSDIDKIKEPSQTATRFDRPMLAKHFLFLKRIFLPLEMRFPVKAMLLWQFRKKQNKITDMPKPASKEFRHTLPRDLRAVLNDNTSLEKKWEGLTSLARNEWICWMTSGKKAETREKRLERLQDDLLAGARRPCCWPGCPHRSETARKWVKP